MGIDSPTASTKDAYPLLRRLGIEPKQSGAPAKTVPANTSAEPSEQASLKNLNQVIQKFTVDIHRVNKLSIAHLQSLEDLQKLCVWMYHAMSLHANIDDFIRAENTNVLLTKTLREQIRHSLAIQYTQALRLLRACVKGPDTEVRERVVSILDDPESNPLKPEQFSALFDDSKGEGAISNEDALSALRNFFYAGQTHVRGTGEYELSQPRPKYPTQFG